MMTILQNGQLINVNYTIENNLIPTIDELECMIKELIYFGGLVRNDSPSYSNRYNRNINSILKDYYLYPGLFENGHISIFDENDNALGHADLFNTYSGTDTTKGTININESKLYNYNNSVHAKIVIDFPTQTANGNIKKLRLYAKPKYDGNVNMAGTSTYNNKTNTVFCGNNIIKDINSTSAYCISFDNNNNFIITDTTNKVICYNNKVYNYTGPVNKIFNLLNKFYIFSSYDVTNKKLILQNIIFDDVTGNATVNSTDTLQLPYVYTNSSCATSLIMNIVQINDVIYSIYHDTNTYCLYVIKYNSDLTINSTKQLLSIEKPLLMLNYLLNNDNCMYFFDIRNSANFKLDIVNGILTKISGADFTTSNNLITSNNDITNLDVTLKVNGVNHWFGIKTDPSSAWSPFMITRKDNIKVPLVITLDTPVTKTSDQTLKFILDINIQ